MRHTNGGLLQKSLSRQFQNSAILNVLDAVFLLLIGMLAITLHAKLRIPLHLPGRNGLVFMSVIVAGRYFSKFNFAGSISCMGASALLLFNVLGFDDPFMPVEYILIGASLDILFLAVGKWYSNPFVIGIICGLTYTIIPLTRFIVSITTGFPYLSLLFSFVYLIATHLLFGFLGGLLGASLTKVISKNKN